MNYNFTKDKVDGDAAENKVLEHLHKSGYLDAYRVEGKESRWDIVIPSKNQTIEVKNDLMAQTTGNLAIEIQNSKGLPSGIYISEATFWVIFVGEYGYISRTQKLKNWVEQNHFRVVVGGDRKQTTMMLVKFATLKEQPFFTRFI
jgi:hypothetical protein